MSKIKLLYRAIHEFKPAGQDKALEFLKQNREILKQHYGFTKMDIFLSMDMKEIDMGYQHISFYYSEKKSTDYRFYNCVYELGGNSLITYYSALTFYKLNVPLSTFDNSDPDDYAKFVARYSASGTFEDDWQNMAIYLCIVYHN